MPRPKKEVTPPTNTDEKEQVKAPSLPEAETIQVNKQQWEDVQKQLKMLVAVADKGRVFNYESANTEKKPLRVKLSLYQEKVIVGWKTLKDELIKHPTTGKTVGEQQEYELMLLGKDENGEYNVDSKVTVNGYPSFSEARYTERIEVEVVGKKEDYKGEIEFDVVLPDGKKLALNSRFVN